MDLVAKRKVMAHRVLSALLGVLALSGWGMFAVLYSSSGVREQDLRAQVTAIWNDRAQILAERNQFRALLDEQRQQEAHRSGEGENARSDDGGAQPPMAMTELSSTQTSLSQRPDADLVTGSVSSPDEVRASVRTAQMVLTKLGHGSLKADGVMGPRTRRAIGAFERANGLPVTGALGPVTVQAMRRAAEAAFQ
jgi:hypothetical protein